MECNSAEDFMANSMTFADVRCVHVECAEKPIPLVLDVLYVQRQAFRSQSN